MPSTLVVVTLPEMGESVTEGSIVEWRVKPGQWIEAGDTLVDVTTDKVDVEVPAPASGVVAKLAAEEGATINVGAMLAEIDTAAAKPDGTASAAAAPPPANGSSPVATSSPAAGSQPAGEPAVPSSYGASGAAPAAAPVAPNGAKPGGLASHRAQRLAEREHLDLRTIVGTGPAA